MAPPGSRFTTCRWCVRGLEDPACKGCELVAGAGGGGRLPSGWVEGRPGVELVNARKAAEVRVRKKRKKGIDRAQSEIEGE